MIVYKLIIQVLCSAVMVIVVIVIVVIAVPCEL